MRRSEDVTGWAFLAEADGGPHAGVAVGRAAPGPFPGAGPGGSLYTRALVRGLAPLASLDELPFTEPVDARWHVHRDAAGVVTVLGPGGLRLAYDLHPVAAPVELVPGLVNTAEVLVAAELEHRSWGIRRYRARLGPTSRGITLSTGDRRPQPPGDAD
ncbi:hypothetical protein ACIRRX_09175 [Streptomyces bacillaris]